nr:MAG TPA: restriction enzyme [Caudoviricetes sp.]
MKYNKEEYNSGDSIGPNGIIFLEEIEPKYYGAQKERQGLFICPFCNKNFETSIRSVVRNRTKSCGCNKNPYKGIQYKEGDIIGEYGVSFIKELPHNPKLRQPRRALFKCPECGCNFEAYLDNVRGGHTKHCGCKNHPVHKGDRFGRLTVLELVDLPVKINKSVGKCQCDCGNIINVKSDNLVRGYKKSCGCLLKESIEKRKVDMSGKKFFFLTALEPTNERKNGSIVWKCKCDCGNICYITQGQLGYIKSCGCSNKSKGEFLIADILKNNSISFEEQKTFDDCKNPKTNYYLRFDFYLPDYNCCIEYNGIQHYEPTEHFGGEESFSEYKYRDCLKTDFCNKNNIKLLVFSYKDSVQKILDTLANSLKKEIIYERYPEKYVQ